MKMASLSDTGQNKGEEHNGKYNRGNWILLRLRRILHKSVLKTFYNIGNLTTEEPDDLDENDLPTNMQDS